MLEIRDIHTYYGASHVLHGVSLKVERGTVVSVLGRNGMGKTTLTRSIVGFTPPRRGQVLFKGADVTRMPSHQIANMGMAIVPQGHRVFASLSVKENLLVAARGQNGAKWNLARVLELFPRLAERLSSRANKLSGGEQKMLACGQALMTNPDLLLLDEPTEGLAPLVTRALGEAILQLKNDGLSILLVEQRVQFALALADFVNVMSKGTIVHQSRPDDLWHNDEVKSQYLGV